MSQSSVFVVEPKTGWDQVLQYARPWNEMSADNFMLSTFWMGNWWQAFGDHLEALATPSSGSRPKLAVGRVLDNDGRDCGFVPGYVSRTLFGRTYKLLASGSACSDYMRLLSRPSYSSDVGETAAEWLASKSFQQQFGRLDTIEIEGSTSEENSIRCMVDRLAKKGWAIEVNPIEGAWRTSLPASWDIFEKSIHKSRRRKVNKAKRLLADGTVKFSIINDPEHMEMFWPKFVALHQKRRAALGQAGCFVDQRFFLFLYNATCRMMAARRAWISVVHQGNDAIAANLIFTSNRTAFMYQSGMDTDRMDLEPGHLINTYSIKAAIESGYEVFDFLRGDETYKEGWNADRIPLFRTRAFAPHFAARLRQTAIAAGRSLKAWSANLTNFARQ